MRKNYLHFLKTRKVLLVFISLFILTSMSGQSGSYFNWSSEVGCQDFDNPDRKILIGNISNAPCIRVCKGMHVDYWFSDITDVAHIEWDVVGGTFTFPNSGDDTLINVAWNNTTNNGSVHFIITYNNGNQVESTVCIEKLNLPRTHFVAMPDYQENEITVCKQQPVHFLNLSVLAPTTNDIINYHWIIDGPDGFQQVSNVYDLTFTFPDFGVYTVTLLATNECNCTSKAGMIVNVKDKGITISCPGVVCENEVKTYTAVEECPSTLWTAIGGTIIGSAVGQSVQVKWDNVDELGFGYLYADASQCEIPCRQIGVLKIPVILQNGKINGSETICAKQQYKYTMPEWPTTDFIWTVEPEDFDLDLDLSDQRNEVYITAFEEGSFNLICTYRNTLLDCGGRAKLKINVKKQAQIEGPKILCAGATANYQLSSPGVRTHWVLQNGENATYFNNTPSINYTFTEPGDYILTATSSSLCINSPLLITVLPQPDTPTGPIIGEEIVCPNFPYTYSIVNTDPDFNMEWNVVNGTIQGTTFGNEVTILFTDGFPTYTIKVRRVGKKTPFCTSDWYERTVTPFGPNFAISGDDTACTSTVTTGYAVNYTQGDYYQWSVVSAEMGSVVVNDTGTSGVAVLWNIYETTDQVYVKVVIGKCGNEYEVLFPVTIIRIPDFVLTASPNQVCQNENFNLTVTATPPLTSFDSISWNIGDGEPSQQSTTLTSPNFSYSKYHPTNYYFNATATIINPNGCGNQNTLTIPITYLGVPKPTIYPAIYNVCNGAPAGDFSLTIPSGFTVNTINWYFNGVIQPSQQNALTFVTSGALGSYYAEITYTESACVVYSEIASIVDFCPPPSCTEEPALTLNITHTDCQTYEAVGTVSGSYDTVGWGCNSQLFCTMTPDTGFTSTFFGAIPNQYLITFFADYTVNNVSCTTSVSQAVIVPYKAKVEYQLTCSSTTNEYTININNGIPSYPNSLDDTYEFYSNGAWITNTPANASSFTTTLAGGQTHTIGIRISRPGFIPCEEIITIDVPNVPSALFTAVTEVCEGNEVVFTPLNTVENCSYLWSFGDGSQNTVTAPTKVYGNADNTTPYNATLTVTDQNGCTVTHTQEILVKENKMGGSIIPDDAIECSGQFITISYLPDTPSLLPTNYNLYAATTLIANNTTGSFSVGANGAYWMQVTNDDGCITNVPAVPVTFIRTPTATILGETLFCEGAMITLESEVKDPSLRYRWYLDGAWQTQFNNQTEITLSNLSLGNHTVKLEVGIDKGDGTYCTSEITHSLLLSSPPEPFEVSFSIDCDTYLVSMQVVNPETVGNYLWSTGQNGTTATSNFGGAFRVTYTNGSGCSVSVEIEVPRNPEEFMWVFPSGCFEYCKGNYAGQILGPLGVWPRWYWYLDYLVEDSGSDVVDSNYIDEEGVYQLSLDNGYCERTSEPLTIVELDCPDCEKVELQKELTEIYPIYDAATHTCYYQIRFYITNDNSYDIPFSISNPDDTGYFNSTNFILPANSTALGFEVFFYPLPTFDSTNPITLFFEGLLPDGTVCAFDLKLHFPPCEDNSNNTKLVSELPPLFMCYPNPASSTITLNYHYNQKALGMLNIGLYDTLGRQIIQTQIQEAHGSVTLPIDQLAVGLYIMKVWSGNTILYETKIIKKN